MNLRHFISLQFGLFLLSFMHLLLSSDVMTLASGGTSRCPIVVPSLATNAELFAANEMSYYLERVTGAKFKIVEERDNHSSSAIYIGFSRYALDNNIGSDKYLNEEWHIKMIRGNLVIVGGGPRGALYGVYEFLERYCGVYWFSADCEVFSGKQNFVISDIDVRGKPAIPLRYIASAWYRQRPTADRNDRYLLFVSRNKGNALSARNSKLGFSASVGSPGSAHTFGYYVSAKNLYEKSPDFFSMGPTGNRDGKSMVDDFSSYQLCLTSNDLRQYLLKRLHDYIEGDRRACLENGSPFPLVYLFEQNDLASYICLCSNCRAVVDAEGSPSALVVDAANWLADHIKIDYPDVFIQTMAYTCTENPPKNIRPHDNVIIRVADLYSVSDPCRPLTHPSNRSQHDLIKKWSTISSRIAIWDYWKTFDGKNFPYVNARSVIDDIRFFRENKVISIMAECEDFCGRGSYNNDLQSFYDFKVWVGYRAMSNPDESFDDLLRIFSSGFYGDSAARVMIDYYKHIESAVGGSGEKFISPVQFREYLTPEFFKKSYELINRALSVCGEGVYRRNVLREKLVLNASLCDNWDGIERNSMRRGSPIGWTRAIAADQLRMDWEEYVSFGVFSSDFSSEIIRDIRSEAELFSVAPPLPRPFSDYPSDKLVDLLWTKFPSGRAVITPDLSAAGGKCLKLISPDIISDDFFQMGLYDSRSKEHGPILKLRQMDLPRDDKYHFYNVGTYTVKPGTKLWFPWIWYVQMPLDMVFDPLEPGQEWSIFVSLRFSGIPSGEIQSVSMDRVILVKGLAP